jgi:ketosteroid isomerase-like protein
LLLRGVRTGFEAWVRGDYDVLRASADPEIEVHLEQASGTGGFEVPVGFAEIYHGPNGYCESMELWSQSFRNWRAEVDEVIEEAPDRILIIGRHSGEGIASGVELEQWGAVRYTVRHGRVVRVDGFFGPNREGVVEAISVQD